jgi:hypothetical protein
MAELHLAVGQATDPTAAAAAKTEEFETWCYQIGFDKNDMEFLNAKGLNSTTLIARAFRDEEAWENKVVQPRVKTAPDRGDKREPEVIEAIYRIIYEEARISRDSDVTRRTRAGVIATAGQPGAPGGATAATTLGAPGTTTTTKRIVKELLQGDWQEGTDAWETATATHPRRPFPSNELLGAELVLARVKHEQLITRTYSPLGLTEIINMRTYKHDGSINMDRPKASQDGVIRRTTIEVQEALEANMWCYRWAKYGSDSCTRAWFEFFNKHSRSIDLNSKTFAGFYWTCQWRLAVNMREGQTFDQAVTSLIDDKIYARDQLHEISSRPNQPFGIGRQTDKHGNPTTADDNQSSSYSKREKRRRSPSNTRNQRPTQPIGKGKSKGSKDKDPIGATGSTPRQQTRESTPRGAKICRAFNSGTCTRKGLGETRGVDKRECKFRHACAFTGCRRSNCKGMHSHGRELAVR